MGQVLSDMLIKSHEREASLRVMVKKLSHCKEVLDLVAEWMSDWDPVVDDVEDETEPRLSLYSLNGVTIYVQYTVSVGYNIRFVRQEESVHVAYKNYSGIIDKDAAYLYTFLHTVIDTVF